LPAQVFFAIFLLAFAIANAQASFPDIGKAKAAVQNIFAILDRMPLIDSESPGAAPTDATTH
jgi:ATP-binding cassette subfamily B (MDR/TAP) protein 1